MKRQRSIPMIAAATLSIALTVVCAEAYKAEAPNVQINAATSSSAEMQETTKQSIARAYASAWQSLVRSLSENRADVIDSAFIGAARDQFVEAVQQQNAHGLRRRYVDYGHKVDVLSYSPEGGSVQLRDRADLEVQLLDGDSVIYRERQTLNYIALLTPTEVTWKVRLLQAVPD